MNTAARWVTYFFTSWRKLRFFLSTQMFSQVSSAGLASWRILPSFFATVEIAGFFFFPSLVGVRACRSRATRCFSAWCFSLSVVNKSKLSKFIYMSGRIVGQQQQSVSLLCKTQVAGNRQATLRDVSYPLFGGYELLLSGPRHRVPPLLTFIPSRTALLKKLVHCP